ncbi:beta-1,3-galactosyltransferase 1-like [Ruditapes philippinarum]|uniref:beta-1,3-galactosyltransferase 1-like n=1 Tax=Ruditapes philippinarum TaxID=129788 RepID=UPI00295A63AB|nr:beta-1,3-galactosyltransferase 1-like [Ruditapes philippinarum]
MFSIKHNNFLFTIAFIKGIASKESANSGEGHFLEKKNGIVKTNDIFEVKLKPGLMELINPTTPKYAVTINASYFLENKELCSSFKNLTILIIVLSAPNNFQRRKIIRETWGNSRFYSSYGTVKVLFLLGSVYNTNIQDKIKDEFNLYEDILQGNFIDSYHNLTHKTIMGYKWLTERCRNAKYIIKTDDDIVINLFTVFQSSMLDISVNQNHVHCLRFYNPPIVRAKSSKWYVEPHQFRGTKRYSPYCLGQYVMFLNDIVPSLYKSASSTPFFRIDDVFNYGIVMNNIPGLKYKQIKSNEFVSYSKLTTLKCWERLVPRCSHVYITLDNESQARAVWLNIVRQNQRSEKKHNH